MYQVDNRQRAEHYNAAVHKLQQAAPSVCVAPTCAYDVASCAYGSRRPLVYLSLLLLPCVTYPTLWTETPGASGLRVDLKRGVSFSIFQYFSEISVLSYQVYYNRNTLTNTEIS